MEEHVGRSGSLGGDRPAVDEGRVAGSEESATLLHTAPTHDGPSIGELAEGAKDLRLARGRLPDGDEPIVISD